MRSLSLVLGCAAAMLVAVGCSSGSTQPTVVTTDEDEIAKYEKMIDEGEAAAAADEQEGLSEE